MSKEIERFKTLLIDSGNFATKPRLRLFGALQEHSVLSIKKLISLLSDQSPATVYRNIKLLESLGVIKVVWHGWGSKLELSDKFQHHHHHITCRNCGSLQTLAEDIILEQRIKHIASQSSFSSTDHALEITGICTECSN